MSNHRLRPSLRRRGATLFITVAVLASLLISAPPTSAAVVESAAPSSCSRLTSAEIGTDGPVQPADQPTPPAAPHKATVGDPGPVVTLVVDRTRVLDVDDARFDSWNCHRRGQLRCGATLIDPEWLLTAAHCVSIVAHLPTNPDESTPLDLEVYNVYARIGSADSTSGGAVRAIAEYQVHPGWGSQVYGDGSWVSDVWDMRHDIALLRLAEPVVGIEPARLVAAPAGDELTGSQLMSYGWGHTRDGSTSQLHGWLVEPIDTSVCTSEAGSGTFDAELMICTDERDSSGTCLGDSGGPLGLGGDRFTVIGITGFLMLPLEDQTCGAQRLVSFTALTPDLLDWIATLTR